MGAQTSKPEPLEGVGESQTPGKVHPTRLYRFKEAGTGGSWELESETATKGYTFYNANEDSAAAKPQWFLEAGEAETLVTDQFNFEAGQRRVIFTAGAVWALRFGSQAAYDAFAEEYNNALFENTFGLACDEDNKQKVFGKDSVLNLGMKETQESRDQWVADMDVDEQPTREEMFRGRQVTTEKDKIFGVRMGAGDRSYLVRNNKIDVFKNVHGGVQDTGVSFNVTPPKGGGGAFTPNKMLLMNRERRMNMLSPSTSERVYNADIETGKVVNEWTFRKDGVDVAMKDLSNDTRAAQLDDRDTFLGIGANRLVRWDMRAPEGVVSQLNSPTLHAAAGKDYARNTNFNCIATSGDGYIVIGSDDGQVRMYSEKSMTRANTAIPGLGAPITAVDVTYDGKWVLATTHKYLMVIKTVFKDKNEKETNGFKSRMGARAPAPRLLRLKPEDNMLVGGAPLAKGKFTWVTEAGQQERWIVASCGNYTVLWNFRQVKLANLDVISYGGLTTVTNYHLIPKNESVVDSVFMHDNFAASPLREESAMVVVTNDHVYSLAEDD